MSKTKNVLGKLGGAAAVLGIANTALDMAKENKKHKQKMEEMEKQFEIEQERAQEVEEKKFQIMGTILFFTYGLATISATQDLKTISTLIGLIQVVMIEIPILANEDIIKVSEKDQKALFYGSIFLIIPFLLFRF